MSKKENFISSVYPYAVKASDILKIQGIKVDPRFIASQWGHETGYGNNTGAKQNNLAGIYAYPSSPYGINGKSYNSLDDFVVDYASTLSNKRYASGINGTTNVTDFARALKAGGYASDPNYAYSGNWIEGFNIATKISESGGSSGSGNILNENIFNDYIIDKDPLDTRDPLGLGSGSSGVDDRSMLEKIFDFVKLGFYQILIFILVALFLYASLIKGSDTEKLVGKVVG